MYTFLICDLSWPNLIWKDNSKNNEKNQSEAKTISNVVIVLKYLLVKYNVSRITRKHHFRTTISKNIHQNFTTYDFAVYIMRTKLEIINKSVLLFIIISYCIKTYYSYRETRIVCFMYFLQKINKKTSNI